MILAFLIFIQNIAYAQDDSAEQHISNLKKGALLVSLKSKKNTIKAFEAKGLNERAEMLREEQTLKNKEIINAFNEKYDFSDVYYFYDFDSRAVKEGDLKGVMLNEELEKDDGIVPESGSYYIARVGNVYSETFQDDISGIVIMDRNMEQLEKPFPFYVKKRVFFVVERTIPEMVEILNEKLSKYYRESIYK